MASEASYVYILSDKSLFKMPNMVHFGDFFKSWDYSTVFEPLCWIVFSI